MTDPTHPVYIAHLAVAALLGEAKLGLSDVPRLKSAGRLLFDSSSARDEAVAAFAERLADVSPVLAMRLCDALAARVGK